MKKSTSARLERLRAARSINDVVAVIKDIAKEIHSGNRMVQSLLASLSGENDDQDGITIDHSGKKALLSPTGPTKLKVGSPTSNTNSLGVRLVKFVAPPAAVVKKHSEVINSLHDNAQELESAEALVKHAFGKAKNQKQVLAALKALRSEVDSSLLKAFSALDSIAKKHLPTEMESLGDALMSYVIHHVDRTSYDDLSKEIYVSFDKENNIQFSLYIVIENLKAKTGFVYDEFYVILTGIVTSKGMIHYFLNTMPDFKVPGKFPVGKEVTTTADMELRVSTLIAHNDIVADLDKKPMALTTEKAKRGGMANISNVDDVYVLDDSVFAIVTKGKDFPKNLTAISQQIIPLLHKLIGNSRRTKGAVATKKITRKGHTVMQYILTPSAPNEVHTLNLSRLQEVTDILELSPDEVDALKEILKRKS